MTWLWRCTSCGRERPFPDPPVSLLCGRDRGGGIGRRPHRWPCEGLMISREQLQAIRTVYLLEGPQAAHATGLDILQRTLAQTPLGPRYLPGTYLGLVQKGLPTLGVDHGQVLRAERPAGYIPEPGTDEWDEWLQTRTFSDWWHAYGPKVEATGRGFYTATGEWSLTGGRCADPTCCLSEDHPGSHMVGGFLGPGGGRNE